MELKRLFETQAKLDEHIMREHPELQWQNNLDWKLLALQVELGECANEWRGFKKWSKDKEKRTFVKCELCEGKGELFSFTHEKHIPCCDCEGTGKDYSENPLLEEYVDVIHFALSIGNDLKIIENTSLTKCFTQFYSTDSWDVTNYFNYAFRQITKFAETIDQCKPDKFLYSRALLTILQLGHKLGFAWEDVESTYFEKNAKNHSRQENGY
ncbi:dUTP diphosphatase [Lysinibacillus xylanilyticus]|uniref:dUTP diphosphatase n=1 Tax=Lysinibacillus xylanilyticus TaxID=582475 RepID=UPI003D047A3E